MSGEVVLSAQGLVRRFASVEAVRGVSLEVRAGELYGLVGPDGAGKTTTIRLLAGLMAPDAGHSSVLGYDSLRGEPEMREAVGYMPQQYSLYGDLSVEENLRFFADLFALDRTTYAERRGRLLHITRLERFADRRADALSGGMYKKLALACALLHQPRALILDEPTNGVDPVSRRELWDLLYEFVADGMAVLLATPYMDEAERCHRVGVIHEGVLLAEGEPRILTRGFAHGSFHVVGGDRAALELAFDERPEVLSLTPHGASLRVVVQGDHAAEFERWARGLPAVTKVERARADFEDVFLGLVIEQMRGAEGGASAQSEAPS